MRLAYDLPHWWERTLPQLAHTDLSVWLLLRWSLQLLVPTLLLLLVDFLVGAVILRLVRRHTPLRMPAMLEFALTLGLGNGIGGLLMFLLGVTRLLRPWAVIAVAIGTGVAAGWWLWRDGWRWRRPRVSKLALVLLVLFLPFLVLQELDLQMPVIEGDSMLYHMASARWYLDHHRLAYHPGIRFNAQPQQTVMIYLRQWMVTGEETAIKLANWEYLLMLAATLAGGARLLGGARLAPLAVLFVLCSPVFCWTAKVEMADVGLSAYLTLGVVLLLRALRQPNLAWCGLAGVMLGLAGASKLQGLVTVAGFLLTWVLVAWWSRLGTPRDFLRAMVALGAGIAAPGIGWWLRSLWYTGSPAYPFFSGNPEAKALLAASVRYGFGHDGLALLLLPWRMIVESPFIFADSNIFGVPLLVLILAGLAAVIRQRGRASSLVLVLLGGFLLYFSFWFITGQVTRYLGSLLPVMALLLVSALVALGIRRVRWWALLPVVPLVMLSAATPSRVLLHGVWPPVTLREQELVQVTALPFYRSVRSLNQVARRRERVYLWFCEDTRFHVRSTSYGDWFGDYNFGWLGAGAQTTQQMLDRLRGAGFRYIVVDRERAKVGGTIYRNDFLQTAFVKDEGTMGDAQLIIRDGRYRVFKLD